MPRLACYLYLFHGEFLFRKKVPSKQESLLSRQNQARQAFFTRPNVSLLGSCWAEHERPNAKGIYCWARCWAQRWMLDLLLRPSKVVRWWWRCRAWILGKLCHLEFSVPSSGNPSPPVWGLSPGWRDGALTLLAELACLLVRGVLQCPNGAS